MSRVFISNISEAGIQENNVREALEWLNWENIVSPRARVFIKPNLTWPEPKPGVTTTPEAIEAVIKVLRGRTRNIMVGESDGGYHSYKAEEAFEGHRLYKMQKEYGIKVINLSDEPIKKVNMHVAGRDVSFDFPKLLMDGIDVFITMPVPKTHVMTGVSLAFKNQWGCLPSPMRLMEHPEFDRKILAINKLLKNRIAIFDGKYFLNGAGPMTGDVVRMNLIIAGDDLGAPSAVACSVMGIDPMQIRHLKLAYEEKLFPAELSDIELNTNLDPFLGKQFQMKRAFLDWISLLGFRNHFFLKLFWMGSTARPLHELLFAVRRIPILENLLYGKVGSPPEWKKTN